MASNPHDKPSPLISVLDTLGSLFTLNLLFLLFSLPVVTIGASVTAMYTVTLRMIDKREGKVFAGFWGAFKKNFKKATIIWMLILLALVSLFGMLLYTNTYEGPLATFYTIFMGIGIVALAVTLPYLFPLLYTLHSEERPCGSPLSLKERCNEAIRGSPFRRPF